jgi:Recombinase
VKLGNPRNIRKAGELGRKASVSAADQFARDILPAVKAIQSAGTTSLGGISKALNKQGIRTARGKRWHVSSVANLLARAKVLVETPT